MYLGELLTAWLLFSALAYALAVALLIDERLAASPAPYAEARRFAVVISVSALATWLPAGEPWAVLPPLGLSLVLISLARVTLRDFTVAGRLLLVTNGQLLLIGFPWGLWFIMSIPVGALTRTLMFAGYPLLLVTLLVGTVQTFEQWEVFCRRRWHRPRTSLPARPRRRYPKVSLHVPVCTEPPEMVKATLDALALLRYPNYEVLVIDNNTVDPRLWQPVEAHCQVLGERFRFFHLGRWPGAKAGALNFALRQTAPDAELISVIDSDYQAERTFLAALVGYFDDPRMGFVQTPHDYRDWAGNRYLTACYWEYRYFFETMLVSRNERDAAITVGTMCLIRRKALEEAGGWAEWCVTEDSELAIRLHALGYASVYLNESFGRGLIPETFAGYKKQRFRWTYGPVQELKYHFRLFLPGRLGRPSTLSVAQKIHHLNHGLDRLTVGLGFLLLPVGLAVVISMLVHREVIPVPFALWLTATVTLVAGFVLHLFVYRVIIGCSLQDALGARIASKALTHTVTMASLWGLLTPRMPWHRTNKFKASPMGLGAVRAARTELLLGLTTLLFAAGMFAAVPRSGLLLLLLIGAAFHGLTYLTAPALAIIGERGLVRTALSDRVISPGEVAVRLESAAVGIGGKGTRGYDPPSAEAAPPAGPGCRRRRPSR